MQKNSYNYDDLISCGEGKLFGEGNAKLPLPPMLMFDRITEITNDTGEFKKGFIKAEAISYSDYAHHGSENKVKEAGKMRVEGKDYIVKDGDILHFRINI